MIKSLTVILLICAASARFSDLQSDSAFYSIILPTVTAVSLIALAVWFVAILHRRGISQKAQRRIGDIDLVDGGFGTSDG